MGALFKALSLWRDARSLRSPRKAAARAARKVLIKAVNRKVR